MRKVPVAKGGLPFIGHTVPFMKKPLALLRESKGLGEVVKIKLLGLGDIYLVYNADVTERILVKEHAKFGVSRSINLMKELTGNGLISNDGQSWLSQRRLMQPKFHRQEIAGYVQTINQYTRQALTKWEQQSQLTLGEEINELIMRIILDIIFGIKETSDEEIKDGAKAIDIFLADVMRRMTTPLKKLFDWEGNKQAKEALLVINKIVDKLIAQKQSNPDNSLLSTLIQLRDESGQGMSHQQLKNETTILALTWCFYLLSQHPEVEAKLLAEIVAVTGGEGQVTAQDLLQMPYADGVINEVIRLFGPIWVLTRRTREAVDLNGYRIPAGSEVWMVNYMLQRDPRYWSDPESFKPERWLAKSEPHHKYAFIPFGGGQRVCIGEPLMKTEAKTILAMVVPYLRLKLEGKPEVTPKIVGTLQPNRPINMAVEVRERKSVTVG
jgi:cytochrome P450